MKRIARFLFLFGCASTASGHPILWGTSSLNPLVIDGETTTAATFNPNYQLRLMSIGYQPAVYTVSRGYATFIPVGTASHNLTVAGSLQATTDVPGGTELNGRQFIMALHAINTGKNYFISESLGGTPIVPLTISGLIGDPLFDFETLYYPTSSTGSFYKGAEIPAFCGWLAQYNLKEADLDGIETNTVNLAFAVNANPATLTDISLTVSDLTLSGDTATGAFTLSANHDPGGSSPVTRLNGGASLLLHTGTSLSENLSPNPTATLSLESNSFETEVTAPTQFFQLRLTPDTLW